MRAVWAKGLPSLREISQRSALLLSCSWRELLLEETLSTPTSIYNRKEAAKSIKQFQSLKTRNQSVCSSSSNSVCFPHATVRKSMLFPNRRKRHALDRGLEGMVRNRVLKAQTGKRRRHIPVGAGNFLLRVCSRTRPVCDSAPGCPYAVLPRGKATGKD